MRLYLGPNESHFEPHRFIISAYVLKAAKMLDGERYYYLDDQYMTSRRYDLEANDDVLGSERREIVARLKKAKMIRPR